MELVDKYSNAVPKVLDDIIGRVVAKVRDQPISVYRGSDAAPILNRHDKHTQPQIWQAYLNGTAASIGVIGIPNRPGRSTHECRSDGVAYRGPVGRKLDDWQCGMDWPNNSIGAVMAAFRSFGERPFHPYASGVEYHHVNLLAAPKVANSFLPLHPGQVHRWHVSSGLFVFILTTRLKNCGYLKQRTSTFDGHVEQAVKNFQKQHHMTVDGIVGDHTWTSVKAAERWCLKNKKREWTTPV